MKQIRWFDRTFEFSFEQNIFPALIERLEGTPLRLNHKISQIASAHLTAKIDGSWSIQENIGHLSDLEPLWKGRLEDILSGKEYMRSADLENGKTHSANHNGRKITDVLDDFARLRQSVLDRLINLDEKDIYRSALHPRLEKPMRVMDLFLFVAEHDDHHLARMTELDRRLKADQIP